jgi:hypothetical protein
MKTQHFLDELEITVNELWKNHPPRIQLLGWWWKKYIPHFQRQQKAMQQLIDSDWQNGGAEKMREYMDDYLKNEIKSGMSKYRYF